MYSASGGSLLFTDSKKMDGYPEIGDAPFQPRSHDYPKQAFGPCGVSQVVFRRNLVDGLSTLVQVPCFTSTMRCIISMHILISHIIL